jgi:hypothetical protein
MDITTIGLQKIGLDKPTWKTIIAAASQEVDLPAALLWNEWTKLEDWASWSNPLHAGARWLGKAEWEVGAKFEQDLNLGFPLGKLTSIETVGMVVPGETIIWWKDYKGIRSCHIWTFEALDDRRTRITNVEVFHGLAMGLVKPLVVANWQRLFESSVSGLIRQAQKQVEVGKTQT